MGYRNFKGRIGGINHWLFAQEDFKHKISRPFRGEEYSNIINGSGVVKGEQKYPKGYQDVLIPELARRAEFFSQIDALKSVKPAEAKVLTVLVGDKDDPAVAASRSYVGMKSNTTKKSGLSSMVEELPSTVTTEEMNEKLEGWNNDKSIAILMFQLPFGGAAGKINTTNLCNRINVAKDGDGLNQVTLGLMSLGAERYYDCCTPSGMIDLASAYLVRERGAKLRPDGIASFGGYEVLVTGRSAIVGEPLFNMLKTFDATTLGPLHTRTGAEGKYDKDTQLKVYKELSQRADIVFSCMGFHPYAIHGEQTEYFFTPDMLKEGVLMIDASTSFRKDGRKPYGDVDPAARAKTSACTLETGGVGPATVTKLVHQGWRGMLYQNVEQVRKAVEDNASLTKEVFADLLASYAGAAKADAEANASELYERAVNVDSHPVYAVDALEAILPSLMK